MGISPLEEVEYSKVGFDALEGNIFGQYFTTVGMQFTAVVMDTEQQNSIPCSSIRRGGWGRAEID